MTKQKLLTQAEALEQEIADRLSQGEAGSYLDYLHHNAVALRARAVDASEED